MTRKRLSTRDRAKLLAAAEGKCHLCGMKIEGGQAWEVSHPIPLAAGGDDEPSNRAPAHKKCHARQTAEIDAPLIAKTRRQQQKHNGSFRSTRPMPGSRRSAWKQKLSGQWERRAK